MLKQTQKIIHWFLELIFPIYCLGCKKEGRHLCADCFSKISIRRYPICFICGQRRPNMDNCPSCKSRTKIKGLLTVSFWDNDLLKEIIHFYKYKFIKPLSAPLGQLMINYLEQFEFNTPPLLVPVPLHSKRLRWRGFNQAEFLAQEINAYFNWPMAAKLLKRRANTLPQTKLPDRNERQENIKNAFQLKSLASQYSQYQTIILIDDVCTTGSTLEECAKALKPLRPKKILALVLCHAGY